MLSTKTKFVTFFLQVDLFWSKQKANYKISLDFCTIVRNAGLGHVQVTLVATLNQHICRGCPPLRMTFYLLLLMKFPALGPG